MRALGCRVSEHRGVSFRTNNPLGTPPYSAVREHANSCSGDVTMSNFKILASDNSLVGLRIKESLFIHQKRPDLNDMGSAFPLKIINY